MYSLYIQLASNVATYVIGFAKRGLIHASNFLTVRMCNSACVWPTDLKCGSRIVLSVYLHDRKICLHSILTHEVMPAKLDTCVVS